MQLTDLLKLADDAAFNAGKWNCYQAAYQHLRFHYPVRAAALLALRQVGLGDKAIELEAGRADSPKAS